MYKLVFLDLEKPTVCLLGLWNYRILDLVGIVPGSYSDPPAPFA